MELKTDHFLSDLEPTSNHFSLANAIVLARLCSLSYLDEDIIHKLAPQLGAKEVFFFSAQGTHAMIVTDHSNIIVVFRATEPMTLEDWQSDLKVNLVHYPTIGGRVHRRFYEALHAKKNGLLDDVLSWVPGLTPSQDVFQLVLEKVRKIKDDINKSEFNDATKLKQPCLYVTGHSYGAALATLFVAEARGVGIQSDGRVPKNVEPVQMLYTFGSPRCGDKKFARHFNLNFGRQIFRVVYNNDTVTRVPPSAFDYSHVGRIVYLDTERNYHINSTYWELFRDRVRGSGDVLLQTSYTPDGMRDHYMGRNEIANFMYPGSVAHVLGEKKDGYLDILQLVLLNTQKEA